MENKSPKTYSDETCIEIYNYVYKDGETPTVLYEFYMHDMPYGTAKARDGDPDNWLAGRVEMVEEDFSEEIEIGRKLLIAKDVAKFMNIVEICVNELKGPKS